MRFSFAVARTMARSIFVAACLSSLGCGGGDTPLRHVEGLVPVTGTVTYNGKPLDGGTISFIPEDTDVKKQLVVNNPRADIDSEGNYELSWSTEQVGALPGKYKVVVFLVEGVTTETTEAKSLIPAQYNNPATSGFKAVVKEDGDNVFDFALTD